MARYYRPLIKATNWALSGLLALLGFSSCGEEQGDEYGTPTATYSIKGKVIDRTNEQTLSDIQVVVQYDEDYYENPYENDTTYTDTNGLFRSSKLTSSGNKTIRIITEDKKGGVFSTDTTDVSFEGVQFTGGKGWYGGTAEKEVTVYLNKKDE